MKTKGAFLLTACLVIIAFLTYTVVYGLPWFQGKTILPARNAMRYGLDLKGGVTISYEPENDVQPTESQMNTVKEIMWSRLAAKNYYDANVTTSKGRRVIVEIPGIADPEKAVKELGQTALLEFIDVGNKDVQVGQVLAEEDGKTVISGIDVMSATAGFNGSSWEIDFEITKTAQAAFAEATGRLFETYGNTGKIAITLDKMVISAPSVSGRIDSDRASITGSFDETGAKSLAHLIESGALPFKLKPVRTEYIGALLGENALDISILAGAIGMLLVMLYLVVLYRAPGISAAIALFAYTMTIIFIFARSKITLTLPGIAGIILSVGMAVDANVIIFERLKDEIREGKTLKSAIKGAFSKAWPSIRDTNITTMLSAGVLLTIGIGPIEGFAWTLIIGVFVSMFSAILLTRFLMEQMLAVGVDNKRFYGIKEERA